MANDVMIDMETLSTNPDCVILTIGAVRFDPRGDGVAERLELRPTIDEQTEESRHEALSWLAPSSDSHGWGRSYRRSKCSYSKSWK